MRVMRSSSRRQLRALCPVIPNRSRVEIMFSSTVRSLVQAEALRHVADLVFHRLRFARHVVARPRARCPRVGSIRPQSMRSVVVLPAPSGPDQPEDLAARDSRFR